MENNYVQTPNSLDFPQASLLLTGATGYLGSRVVELLSEENSGIVAIYRNRVPDPKANLYPIAADLLNKDLLAAPLRGIHTVIHLAWENKAPISKLKELEGPLNAFEETSNTRSLRNLLEAMEAAKTPRIIFVSAVGAHRDTKEPFLREKYKCEQMIINSAVKEKIIIRISPLFGHHRDGGFVQVVKKFMKYQFFYPFPNYKDPISPLHVDDLIDLISKCTKVKMYDFCAIVDLVGGELYSASQIFNIVARQQNKNMFAVGTFIGNGFIKFIERKNEKQELKISDYFVLGSRIEKKIRHKNPLSKLLPEKCRAFKEEYFSAS